MRRRSAVALMLLAPLLAGCARQPASIRAARQYAAAWSAGNDVTAATLTNDPTVATAQLRAMRQTLGIDRVDARVVSDDESGSNARVTLAVSMWLTGLGVWHYRGVLRLHGQSGRWLIAWSPSDIYPTLGPGEQLAATRHWPPRATIDDDKGRPLFTPTPVVNVGIEPRRLTHPGAELATLVNILGIDPKPITAELKSYPPTAFVPVITLRVPDYERVKPVIYPLPGVEFVRGVQDLAPTTGFGRALLGRIGPNGVGSYGLQALFQNRLAGAASGSIVIDNSAGSTIATLATFTGHPGQPLSVTLDLDIQNDAEAALATVSKPAAVVAVRPSDGAVLAVANRPADSSFDRALVGEYPPGSTFKVVSGYALLARGFTPDTVVPCPTSTVIDGKPFRNFEGEARGAATFATDFAISCNTAFVNMSAKLSGADLVAAARAFGLTIPSTATPLDVAAATIGQGRDLVTPLAMALVAAAVDAGTWRPPLLVTSPPQPAGPPPRSLDPHRLAVLRTLMGLVVSRGTAAAAGLPAGTAGKTGTAEFGAASPPATHAWFIGYRGDLAVAVIVEGGGVGGAVAAPIAARFLRSVGGG